jgi:hypothetical protein
MKYEFHYDAGHGWLKVPMPSLYNIGLVQKNLTNFSYKDVMNMNFYLEEDVDLPRFSKRYEEYHGKPFVVSKEVDHGAHAFIRDLPHIHDETH